MVVGLGLGLAGFANRTQHAGLRVAQVSLQARSAKAVRAVQHDWVHKQLAADGAAEIRSHSADVEESVRVLQVRDRLDI